MLLESPWAIDLTVPIATGGLPGHTSISGWMVRLMSYTLRADMANRNFRHGQSKMSRERSHRGFPSHFVRSIRDGIDTC